MPETFTRRLSTRIPVGLIVVVGWLMLEAVARIGFAVAGTVVLDPVVESPQAAAIAGSFFALLIGLPIIAIALSRYALHAGQIRADWEYDWDRRSIVVGLVAGLLEIGVSAVAQRLDAILFGTQEAAAGALVGGIEAAPWAAIVLVLGNGIVGPAAEERVWRGIAQTDFVDRLGVATGIAVTALLFSLKHAVIDGSLGRLFTILALGLIWGIVRYRWGTSASTVAHITTNTIATTQLVLLALG